MVDDLQGFQRGYQGVDTHAQDKADDVRKAKDA